MQPSKEMQSLVGQLALKHDFELSAPGTLKLELDELEDLPLVIERLTETTVRIAHEYTGETGEIECDPEVIFFTGYTHWIAMELRQPHTCATSIGQFGSERKYVELTATGNAVKKYQVGRQKDLATFVKGWVKMLRARGWVDNASNAAFKQSRFDRSVFSGNGIDSVTISSKDRTVTLVK